MSLTKVIAGMTDDSVFAANKNVIINGNFDIWQRGTGSFVGGEGVYTADRWIGDSGSGGVAGITQESFTVGQTDVPGNPIFFLRHNQTTGATSNPRTEQRLEDVNTFSGETITISFFAKVASSASYAIKIRQEFGTGGSPSSSIDTDSSSFTIDTSWAQKEITMSVPSISGKTLGSNNDDHLQVWIRGPNNTTYTLDIARVQLEVGSVATEFERRSFATELAMAQRYYEQINDVDFAIGVEGTRNTLMIFPFNTEKRVVPSTTFTGGTIGGTGATVGSAGKIHHAEITVWKGVAGSLANASWSNFTITADAEL